MTTRKSKAGLIVGGLYFLFAAWTLAIPLFDHRSMAGTAAFATTLPWSLLLMPIAGITSDGVKLFLMLLGAIINAKIIYFCLSRLSES